MFGARMLCEQFTEELEQVLMSGYYVTFLQNKLNSICLFVLFNKHGHRMEYLLVFCCFRVVEVISSKS